jgi:TldD protein
VAAPGVTIVDDGTLDGRRGSLNIDDEGTRRQCTTLIEDGVLVGYMQDTQRAADGHGADRQRPPRIVRAPADAAHDQHLHACRPSDPQEMIRSVEGPVRGQLRRRPGDITSGKYVFSATEAYLIEDGKHHPPVKGAT